MNIDPKEVSTLLSKSRHVSGLYEMAADALDKTLAENEELTAKNAELQRMVDDFDDLQRFNLRAANERIASAWRNADEAIQAERGRCEEARRVGERVIRLATQGRRVVRIEEVL